MNKNLIKAIGNAYKTAFAYQANAYLVNRGEKRNEAGELIK